MSDSITTSEIAGIARLPFPAMCELYNDTKDEGTICQHCGERFAPWTLEPATPFSQPRLITEWCKYCWVDAQEIIKHDMFQPFRSTLRSVGELIGEAQSRYLGKGM